MISGDVLKYLKGERLVITGRYRVPRHASSEVLLTGPPTPNLRGRVRQGSVAVRMGFERSASRLDLSPFPSAANFRSPPIFDLAAI